MKAPRGKAGELRGVTTDALGGPYNAVLSMLLLIHVDLAQLGTVLRKIFDALEPGGVFLVSMRAGEGETDGDWHAC